MLALKSISRTQNFQVIRSFATSGQNFATQQCKVLVVGGGTAGCSLSAKLSYRLGANNVTVLDAAIKHYYQPLWTLVGGGMKTVEESSRPMKDVLSPLVTWHKDRASKFNPASNSVETENGDVIEYEFMVVATGIETRYETIPGLLEALKVPKGPVCSIYSPLYVNRVYDAFKAFKGGNAIFTFPNTPVKCPGAPQKICYIFEDYLRKNKKKGNAKIIYNTSIPNIFAVKYYADKLWEVAKGRGIDVNVRTNLVEILPSGREAVFENLETGVKLTTDFGLLHVTPPMATPESLRKNSGDLVNELGFVNVNKFTLRHKKYPNVFALGDCSSTPNPKTAAAAAVQSQIVYKNLSAVIEGKDPFVNYDGYTSCPLVTGYHSCILAEFDYDFNPLETFPYDQRKERFSAFVMKKDLLPPLYWHLMLNGMWNGPGIIRKSLNFFKEFSSTKV